MKKYKVFISGGKIKAEQFYYSSCRNSKLHIRNSGAEFCEILDMHDRPVSSARLMPNGHITNVTPGQDT